MLKLHAPGARAPLLGVGGVRLEYSSPHPGLLAALCCFLLLCATFATLCYFCLRFANARSQTHSPTANLCSSCTCPVPAHLCHACGAAVWNTAAYTPGFLQLCAPFSTFACFATFAYFLPIPTAKRNRLQLTCAPVASAQCQSTSATCGGGPCGVQLSIPRASCNFVQLCVTLCYFCYFVLLLPTFCQSPQPNALAYS